MVNQNHREMQGQGSHVKNQTADLVYYRTVLDHLLAYTRAEMSGEDQDKWIARLSNVPMWKLKKLDEFNSPFISSVWEFFNNLRPDPEDPYSELGYDKECKQLPDTSSRAQNERLLGKELFAGLSKIMLDKSIPKGSHKKAISELHMRLRDKYPQFKERLK